MISVIRIVEDTMVDGPGFRTSVYCAGCPNACPGCHNPQSWDINTGHQMSTEEIMEVIEADPFANVTFSGGDPMYQAEGFTELAKAIRQRTDKNIWCFTGFTYERGNEYELLVKKTTLANPPQDSWNIRYELFRIVSQRKIE